MRVTKKPLPLASVESVATWLALIIPGTVLPRLSDTLGTKTCPDNQKVWIIKKLLQEEF